MTSPRKPTAGFWICMALVTVLVGYPGSMAVCMVLAMAGLVPRWATPAFYWFYTPIFEFLKFCDLKL